jgi:hypothetical protein
MTNCNQIKRIIDETEQPELLSFEATHHVNACTPCRLFAEERASLRALLNGIPRVNAPINFDAQLKARMNTVKTKPAFSWLSPALYLRFGAASAALVVTVFVAQYNGMFSPAKNIAANPEKPVPSLTQSGSSIAEAPEAMVKTTRTPEPIARPTRMAVVASTSRGNHRVQPVLAKSDDQSISDRGSGLIFRRPSGPEVEVTMLTVSVGAQQQLNNLSGRPSVQQVGDRHSF